MDTKDQIKSKLNIVDVVGEYVSIKRAGSNYKGLCPFHSENSPSFMVSEDKQIYHCFGCGEGGDLIGFVEKMEGLDFIGVLKLLAPKAGVELKNIKMDKNRGQKERLFEMLERVTSLYHQILIQTKHGESARSYLKSRGVTDLSIDQWSIGYAPESWDTALKALLSKGFTEKDMEAAGLVVRNERGGYYDRFRDRIMFPIRDISGRVVGYSARLLKDDPKAGGKYINTPQTLLYDKSSVLFGLDKAKKAMREADTLVLVEGNIDAILSYQVGVENVVASSGTALTREQIELIRRYTKNISLCFDQDEAGVRAALRGIDMLHALDMEVYVIQLPDEIAGKPVKDPADAITIDESVWVKSVSNAIPVLEYLFSYISQKYDLSRQAQQSAAVVFFLEKVSYLNDTVKKNHWLQYGAQALSVSENILREMLPKVENKKSREGSASQSTQVRPNMNISAKTAKSRGERLEEMLYSLLINTPENIQYTQDSLKIEYIHNEPVKNLVKELFLFYNQHSDFDFQEFTTYLESNKENYYLHTTLALFADKEFSDLDRTKYQEEIISILELLKKQFHRRQISLLQPKLLEAEQRKDQEMVTQIMRQIAQHAENL